jgi:hypothetical protein
MTNAPTKLRAIAARVAAEASLLPMGQERACKFAYALGLEDAAATIELEEVPRRGRHLEIVR